MKHLGPRTWLIALGLIAVGYAFVFFAAFLAQASAATVSDGSDPAPYVALLSRSYMPVPDEFTVVPSPQGCPGQVNPGFTRPAACADSQMKVYVDPERVLDPTLNGNIVLLHELGHIVDFQTDTPEFDSLMTDVAGSRLEQFADVWAECALMGPTGDTEIVTPVYSFHVPAAAYAAACDLMRAATVAYGPPPAVYSGAPWRMQARPGDCVEGRFVVPCAQPTTATRKRLRRCSTYHHWRPARCRHRTHR